MDQQKTISPSPPLSGGVPVVRINGARIRSLRESKGLTQLYLSEVVGVTTDTISRWENRRYPSIKLENAEKLAQALEVDLDEILENDDQVEGPSEQQEKEREQTGSRPFRFPKRRIDIAIGTLIILGAFIWFLLPHQEQQCYVSADRVLPPHIPAGQSFPVLIQVQSSDGSPLSLIIKEKIPAGGLALQGTPAFSTVDQTNNTVNWIRKTEDEVTVFAYISKTPLHATAGDKLTFEGSVTLKQHRGELEKIGGTNTVIVAPFHWADTNQDNSIDDEEILAVYDRFSDIEELEFDRDMIDSIWAGTGYYWDETKQEYVVMEDSSGI